MRYFDGFPSVVTVRVLEMLHKIVLVFYIFQFKPIFKERNKIDVNQTNIKQTGYLQRHFFGICTHDEGAKILFIARPQINFQLHETVPQRIY